MSKKPATMTRVTQRKDRREERRREEERLRTAKRRRTVWISSIIGVVVIVIAAIIISNIINSKNAATTTTTANSSAVLASDNPSYPVVDDIACQSMEQLAYHIHAHLSIYINGQLSPLPANLGIAPDGSCYYWLHTHDSSGVIHIESPTTKTYGLGTFFEEWQDYFSSLGYPSQLNTTDGWTVYVDGKPYKGDFHNIQLAPHMLITMAYNSPGVKPDTTYSWGSL
jgi:hypothetical protein